MWIHGCSCALNWSWVSMDVHGCSCVCMGVHVFLFVCHFVLLPSTFFELNKMNVRWRSQPWADFFVEISAIQGFEGAFFEINSGSSSFIKTKCQDWMAFHLSKTMVGKKYEESPGEDSLYSIVFAKTKRPIQPRLDQSLKGLQPSILENQNKN